MALVLGWIPALSFRAPSVSQMLVVGLFVLIAAAMEELGWRGYALPRLLAQRSALFSALLIGVLWGGLHYSLVPSTGRPWLPTVLAPFAFSVILTWLFVQTGGNLSTAIVCHFAFNYLGQFLPGIALAQMVWLEAAVCLVGAGLLIVLFGADLRRSSVKSPALADAG